jgi:hypothetical protein
MVLECYVGPAVKLCVYSYLHNIYGLCKFCGFHSKYINLFVKNLYYWMLLQDFLHDLCIVKCKTYLTKEI